MDLIVHVTRHGVWTVVSVGGDIDLATVPRFQTEMTRSLGTDGPPWLAERVAVDLRGVGFIDDVGLGVLLGARRRVVESGGSFVLVVDSPGVQHTLAAAGLGELFTVVDHVAALDDLPLEA